MHVNDHTRLDARQAVTQHLLDAIEQVRKDMLKVELWASALNGFTRPVPDYDPVGTRVWLPSEQARDLNPRRSGAKPAS